MANAASSPAPVPEVTFLPGLREAALSDVWSPTLSSVTEPDLCQLLPGSASSGPWASWHFWFSLHRSHGCGASATPTHLGGGTQTQRPHTPQHAHSFPVFAVAQGALEAALTQRTDLEIHGQLCLGDPPQRLLGTDISV